MQRNSSSLHQPPLLAIKEEPRLEHRPRLSLSVPHRKCDGGVPCSNCKRNKADCLYTDAQQSRSTWGDLPLSQEKILGVSASVEDDEAAATSERNSKPASALSSSGAAGAGAGAGAGAAATTVITATSSPPNSRVPKSTAQPPVLSPTSATKSPTNQPIRKGYGKQSAQIPDGGFTSSFPTSASSTLAPQAPFIPGHAAYEQDFNLDRRKQQLAVQSTQISRAIRVARTGPQFDTSILLNGGDSGAHRPPDHSLVRGLSQDSILVTQGSLSANNNNVRPRVTSSQSVPNTLWRQDPSATTTAGSLTTLSKEQQQLHTQQQQLHTQQQQLLHHHNQQYHPANPADTLEARHTSILPPAHPIPQYSDSLKREPISAFSAMGQGNSRMSSGSSSTHSMMSARVASQPPQMLHQQQQQPLQQQHQQQQRQHNFLSTDIPSSGFMTGPTFSQNLQQNNFHGPVTILDDQQLPLYDSPQSFGTSQSQFPTGQHQQHQGTQQQFDQQQQLILQLPVSAAGTSTSIQPDQAQAYQFQAQPQLQHQHQQQQQQIQSPYQHQSRQQDTTQQQHLQQRQDSPLGPNHAISSAAPVSSVAIPSGVQPSPLGAWASSTTNGLSATAVAAQNQINWKSSSVSQPTSLDYPNRPFNPQTDSQYSFSRSPVVPTTPTATNSTTPSTAIPSLAGSPAVFSGDYGQQQQQKFRHNGGPLRQKVLTSSTSSPIQSRTEEQRDEDARIRKIANDILDCRQYDYGVFLPRHISQEYPDLWVEPHSNQPGSLDGIPRQVLVLPKDANFLVDVFFENACFYYPVLNRSTVELHLMEPHTAHALFLLNIVFMAACKHLGKSTYIKRAIQFRERARELQYHIDGRVRLSRIQGALLGSQVIYGVFTVVIGYAQLCGTYIKLPITSNLQKESTNNSTRISDEDYETNNYDNDGNETMTDIAEESRRLAAQKGMIPEAVFQQRLMAFWTIFIRDSMSRLYFGWPHGIDALAVTAELPTIKGCVGLGGRRKGLNGYGGRPTGDGSGAGIGKRRGPAMKPVLPEKKLMKATDKVMQQQLHKSERESYRVSSTLSDDDDDDDDDDGVKVGGSDDDEDSDLEQGDIHLFHGTPRMGRPSVDATIGPVAGGEKRGKWSFDGPLLPSVNGREVAPSISGLSRTFLEKQGRGEDIQRRASGAGSGPGTGSHSSIDIKRHTERMKLLLDAEDDVTDGGTYSRILFLEEIKLWSIGRRAGLYLMGRSTSSSVSPLGAMSGSCSTTPSVHGLNGGSTSGGSTAGLEAGDPFATAINASLDASRCSERAWLEDKELQSLQAELMAWEQTLSPIFKFRQDVDAPDINHKVNGKLAVLSLFYYTITIMLQSSYLPIPQYLSSSSRSTVFKSPESISQEYDDLFSRSGSVNSMGLSDDGITPIATTTPTMTANNPWIKREGGDSEHLYPNRLAYFHSQQQQQRQRQNSNSSSTYGSASASASAINIPVGYFNTAHKICTQLSNVLYHHLELMLDSYPNWCTIQSKLNHSLVAALRVSCLNARLSSNSQAIRDEAKAGFKMGSDLFKRQAMLPEPLNIRDWPAEEDVNVMLNLEEEFREMMTTQEEERSRSNTRDQSEEAAAAAAAAASVQMVFEEDPGDRLLYIPQNPGDTVSFAAEIPSSSSDGGNIIAMDGSAGSAGGAGQGGIDYGLFRAEHVFGLSEGFQFDYNIGP
ncbi:hypothetical protein BGZ96_011383 [Linnemannia gamsii]|uniref:Zn(2)-C6 fungal-type domain-containing protein n=1 Tax=Linnemannia gamsii TaxID=64522 RepID=A0ABQ7JTB4_9FUNG|nr:hypothetical protein BGZ96_011383 [Linnemannia gamsii]